MYVCMSDVPVPFSWWYYSSTLQPGGLGFFMGPYYVNLLLKMSWWKNFDRPKKTLEFFSFFLFFNLEKKRIVSESMFICRPGGEESWRGKTQGYSGVDFSLLRFYPFVRRKKPVESKEFSGKFYGINWQKGRWSFSSIWVEHANLICFIIPFFHSFALFAYNQ